MNSAALLTIFGPHRERWADIPGTAGNYRVSTHGRVWSAPRRGTKGGILKTALGGKPHKVQYEFVVISKGRAEKKPRTVHRLVLETFAGPCPAGHESRHLDGNPRNNRLDNLAWGTPAENDEDRRRHGTLPMGDAHYRRRYARS